MQPLPGTSRACNRSCFNPHPARRPDATGEMRPGFYMLEHVSILIRPEGRMQRASELRRLKPHPVSIRIRPEGRMQPPLRLRIPWPVGVSILIRPEGRMQPRQWDGTGTDTSWCFNPHPARRPDATSKPAVADRSNEFQSSSGQKAGCNRGTQGSSSWDSSFNPHPARRPDATRSGSSPYRL